MATRKAALPSSAHIVASIAEPGAGPSYSVRALTAALARQGARVGLHTVAGWRGGDAAASASAGCAHWAHRRDFAGWPLLGAACFSRDLHASLREAVKTSDVLHGHGLWLMPNVYPAWAVRPTRAKLVISPRGMLSAEALAFSRGKKRLFWRLLQRDALRMASCLHATSEAEYAEIRAAGLANPVAVIANGVDLPEPAPDEPVGEGRVVLALGRIHPKKGLDQLVRAWACVEAEAPQWRLRIAGPPELGHDRELRALGAALGLARLSIEGPIYGPEKLAAYRQADVFVLSTRNENFAMTVAEALAAGTPVISTKGAPWAGLERERCGWWVDHGVEPMAAALRAAMATPASTLRSMGARGRAWMGRDFGWDRIADEMLDLYRWLGTGGTAPSTVRLS